MVRSSLRLFSTALHNSTPFVDGALQLVKLHLAHRNAKMDKNVEVCNAIEQEFLREVEIFRPCFTAAASLEVAQQYSRKIYAALRYFGVDDDPLIRHLDLILGRQGLRDRGRGLSQGMFKGVRTQSSLKSNETVRFSPLSESAETVLPSELPNPPQIDMTTPRRPGAVQVPHRYRGHWVLQDPEVAITRNERREDPW